MQDLSANGTLGNHQQNGKSLYRPKGPPIGRSSAMQTDPEVSQKGGGKDVKPRNPGSQSLGARRNVDCDNMNGGDSMSATWMWCHLPSQIHITVHAWCVHKHYFSCRVTFGYMCY
jgi:hypothetical protein